MSNSTQWVKPPASGASGSCMISTNDFALAGASVHDSAGDGLVVPASHVNFDGMLPPSVKAGLEIENAAAAISTPIIEPPSRNHQSSNQSSNQSSIQSSIINHHSSISPIDDAASRFELIDPRRHLQRRHPS